MVRKEIKIKIPMILVFAILMFAQTSKAQQFGVGMWGGMQGCNVSIPSEIKDIEDDIKTQERSLREAQKEFSQKKRERDKMKHDIQTSERKVRTVLREDADTDVATAVLSSLEGKMPTYKLGDCGSEKLMPWTSFCSDGAATSESDPGEVRETPEARYWSQQWIGNRAGRDICSMSNPAVMVKPEYQGTASNDVRGRLRGECATSIDFLKTAYSQQNVLEADTQALEAVIKILRDDIKAKKKDKRYVVEDWRERQMEGETEGEFCFSCSNPNAREVSATDKILGLFGTALVGAGTYYGTKYAVDQNKRLGWPTSPWMAYGMGYPFLMAGIYGAMNGGGAGAFGCGNGGYGGPFGYPPGVMGSPYGGGVYMPGGFPAMGHPGMMAGGMGMMGYPGMMAGGYGMPGGFGMAAGMGFGIGGAYPGAMGMMAGGYPGGMGMAGGYPGGMGMAGFPGGMGMMVGGIGIAGGIAGGFPGGMGMMAGGMAGGFPGGMGMMAGGSMAGMQYQMQMMQAYQQQLSSWMAEQQRMAADYQNRTMLVGRLQQELYKIQSQIQMISVGGGSYYGGGGGGGAGSFPTGNVYPYPGDPNYNPNNPSNPGTIPSRGGR